MGSLQQFYINGEWVNHLHKPVMVMTQGLAHNGIHIAGNLTMSCHGPSGQYFKTSFHYCIVGILTQ